MGSWALHAVKCNDSSCADQDEAISFVETGTGSEIGRDPSVAIGSDGLPIMAARAGSGSTTVLRIIHCNDVACAGANESATDEVMGVPFGRNISIVIGDDDLPVIVHSDNNNGDIYVTHCSTMSCQ